MFGPNAKSLISIHSLFLLSSDFQRPISYFYIATSQSYSADESKEDATSYQQLLEGENWTPLAEVGTRQVHKQSQQQLHTETLLPHESAQAPSALTHTFSFYLIHSQQSSMCVSLHTFEHSPPMGVKVSQTTRVGFQRKPTPDTNVHTITTKGTMIEKAV